MPSRIFEDQTHMHQHAAVRSDRELFGARFSIAASHNFLFTRIEHERCARNISCLQRTWPPLHADSVTAPSEGDRPNGSLLKKRTPF